MLETLLRSRSGGLCKGSQLASRPRRLFGGIPAGGHQEGCSDGGKGHILLFACGNFGRSKASVARIAFVHDYGKLFCISGITT